MLKSKVTFFWKRVKKSTLLMRQVKLEISSSTDDFPSNLKTMIESIVSLNLHSKVRNLTSKPLTTTVTPHRWELGLLVYVV